LTAIQRSSTRGERVLHGPERVAVAGAEAAVPGDLRFDPVDPAVQHVEHPVVLPVEREHPGAEVLDLDELGTVRDQVLEVLVEDRDQVLGQPPCLGVLGVGVVEVDVVGQVRRAGPHGDLQRLVGELARGLVHLAQPTRNAAPDRAGHGRAAPVVHPRGLAEVAVGALLDRAGERVGQLRLGEPVQPLVPVPDEGADAAAVVVEMHLAVGDDVQSGELLVLDARGGGVPPGVPVLLELPPLEQVGPGEVVAGVPPRLRVRADHGGRQQRIGDLL
jgi:hypothetical protein